MKRQLAVCLLWMASITLSAQSYWEETTDTVSTSGYYHIGLSQEIAGLGLNRLKILDEAGREVPFFIRSSVPVKEMSRMEMYDLLLNVRKDSVNTLIVRNNGEQVSRFYVRMKEAEVTKHIAIRGSNDREQWFSVKQRSLLQTENNPGLGAIAIVDFPLGNYNYYELVVTNNSRSPLDIAGVGKMEESNIYGQFIELPSGIFEVKEEENGNSVITFPSMKFPYYISKIELNATSKGHYSRNAHLEKEHHNSVFFEVSSRQAPVFYFDNILFDRNDSRIIIGNQNNPPLTIRDVKLFGMSRYLCAYLDAGLTYHIRTSDEPSRRYDIQNFEAEIPLNLPVVQTTGLAKHTLVEPARHLRFFEKPVFLWGVIVLTGIVLLLICLRMLRELKKKK